MRPQEPRDVNAALLLANALTNHAVKLAHLFRSYRVARCQKQELRFLRLSSVFHDEWRRETELSTPEEPVTAPVQGKAKANTQKCDKCDRPTRGPAAPAEWRRAQRAFKLYEHRKRRTTERFGVYQRRAGLRKCFGKEDNDILR